MRLTHRIHLRLALLMVFALLSAQLGAQMHAYSHLRQNPQSADSVVSHGGACLDCLSFAPLLASAAGPTHGLWLAPEALHFSPDSTLRSLIAALPGLAFRSRAPPPTILRP